MIPVLARAVREVEAAAQRGKVRPSGRTKFQVVALLVREERARIRALAIPPAWTNVWIAPAPDWHIQATGRDAKGRKQYRYHNDYREEREAAKFSDLHQFRLDLAGLRRAATEGQFICLLADRDLSGGGVPVQLCGHPARMAKGPAALALLTGAPLYAVSVHYERNAAVPGSGWGIVCEFSPLVEVPASGTTAEKVAAMTQACADVLGAAVREHTADWHMRQRVFVDDLDASRLALRGAAS